ncbi:tetratricopeptide repeat protein [Persicimonas caeni]|uniref:Tetratricopeptide repeat protein n=1 Tax=Persicimonas caeni TaxID=2292766 RepID=A0A4Y6PR68_PERCE|nr:zinc-ribbon domain-containing protein [Persicimonas caeni]QDG50821.1 tetratricopeptide repeat protein [Persicimonas caeni]QED32042.1 tetratricopeptide repeat protein [Persicimonas caeni]
MDVRCPQCDTLYEIDARQLRGGAATLKCSQCEHVFRLQTHAALSQENQRRWMVKNTTSGDILYFSSFDELHQWILQGKVTKADQVSRTGKKWKRLADIGEFMPIFQAVESISSISASHAAERRGAEQQLPSAPEPASEPDFRSKVKTSQQFGLEAPKRGAEGGPAGPERSQPSRSEPSPSPTDPPRSQTPAPQRNASGEATAQAAPQQPRAPQPSAPQPSAPQPQVRLQTGAFGSASDDLEEDDEWSFGEGSSLGELEGTGRHDAVDYEPQKSRWPIVVAVMLLVVAGGGAAVYFARPDLIDEYLPTQAESEVVDIAEAEQADEEREPEKKEASPRERIDGAVANALDSAQKENAKHLAAGIAAAGPKLEESVAVAIEAAVKAAEEPDAEELLAKAKRYLEAGHPRRARQKFHAVLEEERNNVEAITGLGWSLLALGSPAAASAQFRKALNYNPSYGDAYIGLGKAEREQGNHQAALDAYQNYLSRFPGGSKASIASYQADKLKKALGQ